MALLTLRRSTPSFLIAAALVALAACSGGSSQAPGADASADAHGDANTDAAGLSPCGAPDRSLVKANAAELFAATRVPTFDLFLPPAEWESLKVHARDELFVPAQACYDGRAIGTVGLRFKGSYGSLYGCFDAAGNLTCPRLSMKLKFDKYEDDLRFFGLKRLAFNAYLYDDSRMKEKLAYDLFREAGLITPRAAWAVVRVNGASLGLFGMVEVVDGRFAADRFPGNPDANLYKELWPTHAADTQIVAALETNEDVADIRGYHDFAAAFTAASGADALSTLGRYMDLDQLATFMAVEDAVVSYDGTSYFWTDGTNSSNHNYYMYEDAPSHFTLIPWDVESTFWLDPNHAAPHWTVTPADCSQTYPYWDGVAFAPACDGVFRALHGALDQWRSHARALLDGPFAQQAMEAAIDRHEAVIAAAAHADPTPPKYGSFDDAVANLRGSIPALRAHLEALIAPRAP